MDWTTVPQPGLRAKLAALALCLAAGLNAAHAGPTDLADVPMANASTATILPNIMLDIDNSGSMGWGYMPDYVRYQSYDGKFGLSCRGPAGAVTCEQGDPPFNASSFNSLYYNPAIRYMWPTKADGTRLADKTSAANTSYGAPWAAVPSDGYGIQTIDDSSGQAPAATSCYPRTSGRKPVCPPVAPNQTIDLVTGYPERTWCSNAYDKNTCRSAVDPVKGYIYPDATYQYLRVAKGAPFYYNVTVEWCDKQGVCQDRRVGNYNKARFSGWSRVNIVSTTKTYVKAPTRTDCAGTTCSYEEEMSNFATWYAWYRTRVQMAKSAIGLSFKDVRGTPVDGDLVDANFLHARVGLTSINDDATNKVEIENFDDVYKKAIERNQKEKFYGNLYAMNPSGSTPLRAALKSVGEMYAGDTSIYKTDPVQFSCQKNYAILATDGYWNDVAPNELPKNSTDEPDFYPPDPDKTDQDRDASRPSKDDLKTPNTLADIAYYYYHTDLRTNCPAGTKDLCSNNVTSAGSNQNIDDVAQHQHMTTFTIGLGVDGTLKYDPNYKTSNTGDFHDILQATKSWPAPKANLPETIDDLWHAAVNGRGTYFSAKNPATLEAGLRRALSSIDSTSGSGAAAATSNLLPTQGDHSIYMATYRTLKWDAEVSAYNIDVDTGAIIPTPIWQAEPLMRRKITDEGSSDRRTIFTGYYNAKGGIVQTQFSSDPTVGLPADQVQKYFDASRLSQYASWNADQISAGTPASLLNYLRGQDRNEDQSRPAGYPSYQRLYRDRDKILGDIVHAQPIFVGKPTNSFIGDGYPEFKAKDGVKDRAGTLYVASNDGMLHAFDSTTGQERWAFIPPQVLPALYRLADVNYESKHRYYLDGPLTINDAVVGSEWATVLIGAMGKGGRGYYALDVTKPDQPKVLWDFTADKNPNLGYTYGAPLVTKRSDGKWVAIVASGYNNVPETDASGTLKYEKADGKGHIFVLDLADGSVLTDISTGAGDTTTPSGLAWINAWVDKFEANNAELVVYGGDLLGTMWRFNIDKGTASHLIDLGPDHPIMVAPELGEIDGQDDVDPALREKSVYFGTGRYLGKGDLTTVGTQTLYGIRDDNKTTVEATTLLAATASGTGTTRSVSGASKSIKDSPGWYLDLIDKGERVAVNPRLYFGTVLFSTTVPSSSECQPGGYSWLYQLNAETGGAINNRPGAMKFNSPVVGVTVSQLPNSKPIIHAVTADGRIPDPTELNIGLPPPAPRRILYREMSN